MTQVFVFWLVLQWIGGGHLARSEAHSGIFNDQDIQRHDSACTGKRKHLRGMDCPHTDGVADGGELYFGRLNC